MRVSRDWLNARVLAPIGAVVIFVAQCGAWMGWTDDAVQTRPDAPEAEVAHVDEWNRRELARYLAQQTVLMQHAHDVRRWCDWVDREPSLDEPYEVWRRWLDEALPIYLFTFGSPSVCDLPNAVP